MATNGGMVFLNHTYNITLWCGAIKQNLKIKTLRGDGQILKLANDEYGWNK